MNRIDKVGGTPYQIYFVKEALSQVEDGLQIERARIIQNSKARVQNEIHAEIVTPYEVTPPRITGLPISQPVSLKVFVQWVEPKSVVDMFA